MRVCTYLQFHSRVLGGEKVAAAIKSLISGNRGSKALIENPVYLEILKHIRYY